jgi:mRNA-degrading endonuclease RelE of RelBE toxin-antitoxin system
MLMTIWALVPIAFGSLGNKQQSETPYRSVNYGRVARLTESFPIEIRLTPDFRKQLRKLEKRYRKIKSDLEPILIQIQMGEIVGDRLQGLDADVFKVRIRNSDTNRGKSGGYRVIYWLKLPECVVLLDIYSKSDRDDIEVNMIQDIITEFDKQIDDETE